MSNKKNKLVRKVFFAIVGTILGGALGKAASDGIETALELSDSAGDILEAGFGGGAGLAGGYAGEALEDAIWTESDDPPTTAAEGDLWKCSNTGIVYTWTGYKWLKINTNT